MKYFGLYLAEDDWLDLDKIEKLKKYIFWDHIFGKDFKVVYKIRFRFRGGKVA